VDYDQVLVDWAAKPPQLLAANPMGKVPTMVHYSETGDRVITAEELAACNGSKKEVIAKNGYLNEFFGTSLLLTPEPVCEPVHRVPKYLCTGVP